MTEPAPTRHDEVRALERLEDTGDAIVTGVEVWVPRWAQSNVTRLLESWGGADAEARARAEERAREAGEAAARRIAAALGKLFAVEPELQTATPLELVRSAYREPTEVLAAAGVPPIARDEFDERAWPDDVYGLVPRTLGDLGDPELAPLHLAWGMAKATVIRARRSAHGG